MHLFEKVSLAPLFLRNKLSYSGPVDFFLSSAVQEQYFELILELVEDRGYTGFFMGRALLCHMFQLVTHNLAELFIVSGTIDGFVHYLCL